MESYSNSFNSTEERSNSTNKTYSDLEHTTDKYSDVRLTKESSLLYFIEEINNNDKVTFFKSKNPLISCITQSKDGHLFFLQSNGSVLVYTPNFEYKITLKIHKSLKQFPVNKYNSMSCSDNLMYLLIVLDHEICVLYLYNILRTAIEKNTTYHLK